MNNKNLEGAITSIFEGITAGVDAEADELASHFPDQLIEQVISSIRRNDYEIVEYLFNYKWELALEGLVAKATTNSETKWLLIHARFVEKHFEQQIVLNEGNECCHDKSKTIVKNLIRFYETGQPISFNYEQEYTFHLPETIFTTHSSIINFYQGIKHLFYGKPTKYITCLADIQKQALASKAN